MPSGWGQYYVVFLSAVLALFVPASLAVISYALGSRRRLAKKSDLSAVDESVPGGRINIRFFLGINVAIVLISLLLVLIPCVGVVKQSAEVGGVLQGLLSIVTIVGFVAFGLLYATRKGDLDWLRSFRKDDQK